jgi:ABC-type branched-subunit amino acid transport system permease subunit
MSVLQPFLFADFWIGVGVVAGTYGIFTLGLQQNVGFTGILNFGQAGFMAVGAYTAGLLVVNAGWSFWASLPVGTLAAVLAGLLVGLPSLRLRADYFAIATIAFGEIVRDVAQNSDFTGGNQGLIGYEGDWRRVAGWMLARLDAVGLGGQIQLPLLIVVWITFGILLLVLERLRRTPWGRVLRAIREDEDAARAVGKNVFLYKLQSLAIAAGLASIAGYLLALDVNLLYPSAFEPTFTFLGYAILVLGGFASYGGVAVGTVVLWTLMEGTRLVELPLTAEQVAALRFIVVGLILVLVMALRPQGLFGKRQELEMSRNA